MYELLTYVRIIAHNGRALMPNGWCHINFSPWNKSTMQTLIKIL